jgi:Uma2 family endonuclease
MLADITAKKKQKQLQQEQNYWDLSKTYTFDEYFELEENAPFKSEFHNGKISPMPGGTLNHAVIIGNLFFYLKMVIKQQSISAKVYNSEVKVLVKAIEEAFYPDNFIVLPPTEVYRKDKAVTNPSIIFEVLSDSTEGYDRGEKFRKYKMLSSFQEYVLIEQDQPVIDVLYKKENGAWELNSYIGLDDTLILNTLDIKIPLSDIYEDAKGLTLPQYKMDLE